MSTNINGIKMETKETNTNIGGREPVRIHTGLTTPVVHAKTGVVSPIQGQNGIKISSIGMEKHLTDTKPKKVDLIEIDNIGLEQLVLKCVDDLKTPRLMNFKGTPTQIEFITKFDPRLTSIFFKYNIDDINRIIGVNEETLADFFSSFFYTNLNKYSLELFSAIPSLLPLMTIETLSDNGIRIIYH